MSAVISTPDIAVPVSSGAPVSLSHDGEIAIITISHPPVNALSQAVRQGLLETLQTAARDVRVQGVIIVCEGRTFIVGGDIREFDQPLAAPHLSQVIDCLDAYEKPVLAAMHGTALGGGFEIALACDIRVAQQDARIGLPEIKLGILPGTGGTQRLPRLIGVEAALRIILSGEAVEAVAARELGAIDHVVAGNLLPQSLQYLRQALAAGTAVRKVSRLSARCADPAIFEMTEQLLRQDGQANPAALYCIGAVQAALELPFADGSALEAQYGKRLLDSPQSRALRAAFFANRHAARQSPTH